MKMYHVLSVIALLLVYCLTYLQDTILLRSLGYINNFTTMFATVYVLIFKELQLVVVIYIILKGVECIQTHKSKGGFKTFYQNFHKKSKKRQLHGQYSSNSLLALPIILCTTYFIIYLLSLQQFYQTIFPCMLLFNFQYRYKTIKKCRFVGHFGFWHAHFYPELSSPPCSSYTVRYQYKSLYT